jgi:acyl carrier protein
VELGKRDIFENRPLGMRALGRNVAFFGVDLTQVLGDPAIGARLLTEIDDLTARRTYRPLPHSVFPAARVEEAFRLLQHSRHIGKVVVAFDPLDEPPLIEPAHRAPRLDPEGTYLVTGGTGGFGAATAEWLARLGARRLALVSRRGPDAPEAAAVAARLAGQGVRAVAYAADAGDPHAMRRVVEEIDASGHPLRGVAHCAMHLDDAPLAELTPERIAAVLAPKLGGAAVLDRLTRDRECDLFLLHSSTTTVIAANLYLEALARRRHRSSGTGLAVAWGAISDVGYVARNDLTGSLAAFGLEAVAPQEAFAAAERLLGTGTAVAAVARVDWARAGSLLPLTSSPRLSAVVPDHGADGGMSAEDLRRALAGMSGEEALAFITDNLTTSLAEVLHMDPGQLDHHRRLDEYGVDSLMAAELLVSVHKRYRVDIPPMELLRSRGTIADIARTIHVRLGLSGLPDTTAVPGPRTARENAPLPAADPARP